MGKNDSRYIAGDLLIILFTSKKAPICHDNLPILIPWPFECRPPYRSFTHLPRPLLSLRAPLPTPLASFLSFAEALFYFFVTPPHLPHLSSDNFFLSFSLSLRFRFSIDPQSDPEALFRISPETGLITTAMELDREREHWHNITVIASQRGQRPQRCVIRAFFLLLLFTGLCLLPKSLFRLNPDTWTQ